MALPHGWHRAAMRIDTVAAAMASPATRCRADASGSVRGSR